ncbi:penicillin-binding protein 1A [Glaciimonas sp. Gout2]|uniref:penicillin-binding protein 1A n=1 Tax=unclassified Glaciimonas TaxID=2644401 RepID=UPI002B227592|nr:MULTISPECIES: penicillin-binding protein 1A [unclassified Glaciimonas]MEB0013689.1 penicillin-binding protein 1A [Glaciimonas sp. Cout2]MEB0081901.1 penicillin-binding protein 1A [Glaciimonas sp. Gout2]
MHGLLFTIGGVVLAGAVIGGLLIAYALVVMQPQLPDLGAITDYRPKVPLRIYTADHVLIGEFGEERRSLVKLQDIPANMKNAVLAIEDARFYQHGGIDLIGILRAIGTDIMHGGASQGASTITMQVARNVFLSSEKTYTRKIYEILLAYKIENALTKDQILEVYMNQIFLGQRSFGFAAAARAYFGKELKDVTLAQAAMLAGLPKAPSAYNPVVNPKRARIRQEYILKRMLQLEFITQPEYDQAFAEDIKVKTTGNTYSVHAEYATEMVRQMLYTQYKDEIYTRGLSVTTTLNSVDQQAGYDAVRKGVMDYDRRHGYRGPEGLIVLPSNGDERDDAVGDALDNKPDNDDIVPGVVLSADSKQVQVMLRNDTVVTVSGEGLRFAAAALSPKAAKNNRIQPGSVIRVMQSPKGWQITQLPSVEATLVALTPQTGAIKTLIGGFDFNQNKFNHVTQAWRQPGSTFKPFIYSAALEKGFGPASIINDSPVSFPGGPGQPNWEPKDDDTPDGPMPMRTGLQRSKNLVTVRLMDAIGAKYAQDFVTTHFGFDRDKIPPYLPTALGAGQTTPLQLAGAYAVLANGGYRVNPYLISEVVDAHGVALSRAQPEIAGQNATRVLDARNSYVMTSLLQSVAQRGTGAGTNVLGRTDIAGKTGTTNDAFDGWFAGYQNSLVAVAWMGFDQPKTLGSREFGAQLALPIWVSYMGRALRGVPQVQMPMPEGITTINNELFFDNFTPGNGFIASLGVGGGSGTNEDGTPATAEDDEKRSIMKLFDGH